MITRNRRTSPLLIALFICSCATRSSSYSHWPDISTCKPPCWEGIIVGSTTVREAKTILASGGNATSIFQASGHLWWQWRNESYKTQSTPVFQDSNTLMLENSESQIVRHMHLIYPKGFTLKSVVDIFGPPDEVYLLPLRRDRVDGSHGRLNLVYKQYGFAVSLIVEEMKSAVPFLPEAKAYAIQTFLPNNESDLKELMTSYQGHRIAWKGYVSYADYCASTPLASKKCVEPEMRE